MLLTTMAGVMEFVARLETESAAFYREAAARFPELEAEFSAWAKENVRAEKQIRQTYYGVITDTLESNYCFKDLDSDAYRLDLAPPAGAAEAKAKAKAVEETIRNFYQTAAACSEGLMADVPRIFQKTAKKRTERLEDLG